VGDTVAVMAGEADFIALSKRAQVARMRSVAVEALRAFPVAVDRLTLLQHGFNTTFRIDTTDGRKLAMRINVNSRRSPANIAAEVQWLDALARETDLVVAAPLRTIDGRLTTVVHSPDLGRELSVTVFSWLNGRDLGEAPTLEKSRAVGVAMAKLHDHAATWRPTNGAELSLFDDPFWTLPDRLTPANLGIESDDLSVLRTMVDRSASTMARLFAAGSAQPIHTDLHDWNVKWYRGRLSVFDFDDSGIGLPLQDLAVATYYRRPEHDHVDALFEGYVSVRSLPEMSVEDFETLVAHRNLLLLNDLLVTTNAEHRAIIPNFTRNTVTKLRNFLDTGVYRHDLEGLLPLGEP
jgi:Ser/Thr protein kinase RdoA (MazF antagonist)